MPKTMISHSAASKLQECGFKYKLHYIDKIRSKWRSNNLSFGAAIDDALNYMLLYKDKNDVLEKSQEIFDQSFSVQKINKKEVDLMTYQWALYSAYDLDHALLDDVELSELKAVIKELGLKGKPLDILESILNDLKKYTKGLGLKRKEALKKLPKKKHQFYNACNWCACRHRGFILLEEYYKKIIPQIVKVHSVQKKIKLESEDGHELIGYIDALVKLKDIEGVVILDNKTSSIDYTDTSVLTSQQLSVYCYVEGIDQAGYAVVKKGIIKDTRKTCKKCGIVAEKGSRTKTCAMEFKNSDGKMERCNGEYQIEYEFSADTQLIVNAIPYETQKMVIENLDQSLVDILNKRFCRNLQNCVTKYGECDYFDKCWLNKEDDELDLEVVVK